MKIKSFIAALAIMISATPAMSKDKGQGQNNKPVVEQQINHQVSDKKGGDNKPKPEPKHEVCKPQPQPQPQPKPEPKHEVCKPQPKPEPKHEVCKPQPQPKPEPKHEVCKPQPQPKPEPKHEVCKPQPQPKPEPKHEVCNNDRPKHHQKPGCKPEPKPEPVCQTVSTTTYKVIDERVPYVYLKGKYNFSDQVSATAKVTVPFGMHIVQWNGATPETKNIDVIVGAKLAVQPVKNVPVAITADADLYRGKVNKGDYGIGASVKVAQNISIDGSYRFGDLGDGAIAGVAVSF